MRLSEIVAPRNGCCRKWGNVALSQIQPTATRIPGANPSKKDSAGIPRERAALAVAKRTGGGAKPRRREHSRFWCSFSRANGTQRSGVE